MNEQRSSSGGGEAAGAGEQPVDLRVLPHGDLRVAGWHGCPDGGHMLTLGPRTTRLLIGSPVLVPAGTRIQVGVAGEAFGQPGGLIQVRLLEEIPLSSFGKGAPLAP